LWWTIPVLNYYTTSFSELNPEVNLSQWSWTHS
jgi:hypothetical protein